MTAAPGMVQNIAMGVGVAGAMTQISNTLIRAVEGVSAWQGRDDEFRADTPPGTIDFYLENYDGRFTPDNLTAAVAAGYATAVTEGMQVSWSRGGKLGAGKIRTVEFAGSEQDWGIIHVTCDDMLGSAARHTLGDFQADLFTGAGGMFKYPFSDAPGSLQVLGSNGAPPMPTSNAGASTVVFGGVSDIPTPTVATFTRSGTDLSALTQPGVFPTQKYGTATLGGWGVWIESLTLVGGLQFGFYYQGLTQPIQMSISFSQFQMNPGLGTVVIGPVPAAKTPYFIAFTTTTTFGAGVWTITVEFWINGVSYGVSTYTQGSSVTSLTDAQRTPSSAQFSATGADGSFAIANLSHTLRRIDEYPVLPVNAQTRLLAIAATTPEITLDTVPTMSPAILGPQPAGGSTLDALNAVMFTEQGYIYTTTTGTLLAPVQKITTRARSQVRGDSTTITANNTFSAKHEGIGVVGFERDLTNMVSIETATGPDGVPTNYTTTASSILARVGSKNNTDTVLLRDPGDRYVWATDRLYRGANVQMRAPIFTVDALVTSNPATGQPNDRTPDLLALKLGDRIRITDIASAPLGFSTWDAYILGIREHHSLTGNVFQFSLAPVLPDAAHYDGARYAAGGTITLAANINAAVTSMTATSTDALFTIVGGDFPQNITIDGGLATQEIVTLSAVAGATATQTYTMTRGVLGSTAQAHTTGAPIEIYLPPRFGF